MSEEPKYELATNPVLGWEVSSEMFDTWDLAAKAAEEKDWGYWQSPHEFVLREGIAIKAVRS